MQGAEQAYPSQIEKPDPLAQKPRPITVAQYILHKLHRLKVPFIHSPKQMRSYPLCTTAFQYGKSLIWDSVHNAIHAAHIATQCQGFSAVYCPDHHLHTVFDEIVQASYNMTPLLFIVRRHLKVEAKELCSLPLSVREKSRQELRRTIKKTAGEYYVLDDQRNAAYLIDKALDTSLELSQPVVLDLPDEIALSPIPQHTYRKVLFNHEDLDLIRIGWRTILSRLEQARNPLFILGHELWPQFWHKAIFDISEKFQIPLISSSENWGHLGSSVPEQMQGYKQLEHLTISQEVDSLFVFGVSPENRWLEETLMHHDVADDSQELFVLHSHGIFFGDYRDTPLQLNLKEFFAHSPHTNAQLSPLPNNSWNSLLFAITTPASPLFIPNDTILISWLTDHTPCAQLFIQPQNSDETWFSTVSSTWQQLNPEEPIFIAGSPSFLSTLPPIQTSVIFLIFETNCPHSTTHLGEWLDSEEKVHTWKKGSRKRHGCIFLGP